MQPENSGGYWQPHDDAAPGEGAVPSAAPAGLRWEASEYVHHEKGWLWFVPVIVVALAFVALDIFLIRSITFSVLVIVMAITIIVFASRPPRIMHYEISPSSIQINDKTFAFHDFRYFGIIQEGPLYSALLVPNKRFMPAVNVYFPPENGEQIVDMLGARLPMEKVHLDIIDQVTRKLRF